MTEYENHDVVEFTVEGKTITGVVMTADDESAKLRVRKNAVETTTETETVWVEGNTAYVAPDELSKVGSPDTDSLHPEDYRVDEHVDRLEADEEGDETDPESERDEPVPVGQVEALANDLERWADNEDPNGDPDSFEYGKECAFRRAAREIRDRMLTEDDRPPMNSTTNCPQCRSENVTKHNENRHAADMECDHCEYRWAA